MTPVMNMSVFFLFINVEEALTVYISKLNDEIIQHGKDLLWFQEEPVQPLQVSPAVKS